MYQSIKQTYYDKNHLLYLFLDRYVQRRAGQKNSKTQSSSVFFTWKQIHHFDQKKLLKYRTTEESKPQIDSCTIVETIPENIKNNDITSSYKQPKKVKKYFKFYMFYKDTNSK